MSANFANWIGKELKGPPLWPLKETWSPKQTHHLMTPTQLRNFEESERRIKPGFFWLSFTFTRQKSSVNARQRPPLLKSCSQWTCHAIGKKPRNQVPGLESTIHCFVLFDTKFTIRKLAQSGQAPWASCLITSVTRMMLWILPMTALCIALVVVMRLVKGSINHMRTQLHLHVWAYMYKILKTRKKQLYICTLYICTLYI